tara:strand:+ start:1521 stop:2129 length:609 start_codon:yes stop_codon:yes gene_type:complete
VSYTPSVKNFGSGKSETIDLPTIGSKSTVTLGESMLSKRTGYYRDCLIPNVTFFTSGVRMQLNTPMCADGTNANSFRATAHDGRVHTLVPSDEKRQRRLCIGEGLGIYEACKEPLLDSDYQIVTNFVSQKNSFQQSIEYLGHTDQVLKFVYAEMYDDSARPSFNRNFEVDLRKDSILTFKGASLEILDYSNSSVTYKVLENF